MFIRVFISLIVKSPEQLFIFYIGGSDANSTVEIIISFDNNFISNHDFAPLKASNLDDALKKQSQLEQNKQQAETKLKDLQYSEDIKKKELNAIGSQILVAKANLQKAEVALNRANEAVTSSEQELSEKQKELDQRREVLRYRVRGIYEESRLSYLEILFQSKDLRDFITRMEYFQKLIENDQNLLTDINDKKQLIEVKTQDLREKRVAAEKLQQEAANANLALDQKRRQNKKH